MSDGPGDPDLQTLPPRPDWAADYFQAWEQHFVVIRCSNGHLSRWAKGMPKPVDLDFIDLSETCPPIPQACPRCVLTAPEPVPNALEP